MNRTNESVCLSNINLLETSFIHGTLNVPGLVGILMFYGLIFAVGIYASWRGRRQQGESRSRDVMLAGRNMNEIVGVCTLTATWVGGDYVNGTAEFIINPAYRLIWCQAPLLFSLAMGFSGIFFAKKMWNAGYVTMLDPFQERYGRVQTALLYIGTFLAEVSFGAISFAVLGASLNVIVGISYLWAVILSAIVALVYTILGGLSSVAYTDVVQLAGYLLGLLLAIPFAVRHPAVESIVQTARGDDSWLGQPPEGPWISHYIDISCQMFFGAVPWQLYFQRVLSQKSAQKAMNLSLMAAVVAIICSCPAVTIGAIAASTDWNMTGYRDIGEIPMPPCDYPLALPLVMRFLTPTAVGVIGLGAVSAAVMSSTDSIILSSSSMFAHNVYSPFRNAISDRAGMRSNASDTEVLWVLRGAMLAVAATMTIIAITVKSVVALVMLSVDIPYCILFPQLLCVIHLPRTNSYGSFFGFVVGVFFRLSAGEPFLFIPALIKYPWYQEDLRLQLFPIKTLTTVAGFVVIVAVSWLTDVLAKNCRWFSVVDEHLFRCYVDEKADESAARDKFEFEIMIKRKENVGHGEGKSENLLRKNDHEVVRETEATENGMNGVVC